MTYVLQPTQFEMRRKNEKFAKDIREGKKGTHVARAQKLAERSPVSALALGLIIFVVFGGGAFDRLVLVERGILIAMAFSAV